MRIPLIVHIAALACTVLGCEEPTHPPGAPPCESVAVDSGPQDGSPQPTVPCPAPSTGGTPGGSRPPPILPRGAGGLPIDAGLGIAGFSEWKGAGGLRDVGGAAGCCGSRNHDEIPLVGGALVR